MKSRTVKRIILGMSSVLILSAVAVYWLYVKKNRVNRTYNGVITNKDGIWYFKDGEVDLSQNGLMMISDTEGYYFKDGKVDSTYTGIIQSGTGWWYVQNGKVNFSYTGLAKNAVGWWYIKNGKIDWSYNGTVKHNGVICNVVNGKVVS